VTQFLKITQIVTPAVIEIFDFTICGYHKILPKFSKNYLVILGHVDLFNTLMGRNSILNAAFKD